MAVHANITRRQLLKSAPPAIAVAALPAVAEASAPLSDQEQIDLHVKAIHSILLRMYPQSDTVGGGIRKMFSQTGDEVGAFVVVNAYRQYIDYSGPGAYECSFTKDGKVRQPIYWVEQTPSGYRAKHWFRRTGETQGGWHRSFGDGLKFLRKLT